MSDQRIEVPRSWDEVTPSWMTRALSDAFPGAVVDRVELGPVDAGTTSRAVASLGYSAGTGPSHVFVKAQGRLDHRLVLAAIRGLRPEAWYFASGEKPPLERPEVYATAVDSRRLTTVLVMEDLTARGGVPNVATAPLTPDQVSAGLRALARLHARYWERPLPPALRFLRPWSLATLWSPLAVAGATVGVRRVRAAGAGHILPSSIPSAADLIRSFTRWASVARRGPRTVLHGDAHVGNTYTLPGCEVGFLDWQLIRTGSWAHDVGYFMVSALTVPDRRAHQRALLDDYLDALREAGVTAAPDAEQAWTWFRATPAYGLGIFLQTLALGDYQTDVISMTCIERFGAAADDLECRQAQAAL